MEKPREKIEFIFEQGQHKWAVIARDPERPGHLIDTNEYLVQYGDQVILIDPGGIEIFPAVFSALADIMDPMKITTLFASHQDPDIISSLPMWMELNPDVKCYLSWLWASFVPHFGGREDTFHLLKDEGEDILLGELALHAVPAHYLHSAGNFHLYDPKAKILFTGDVGAALLAEGEDELFVTDFDNHIKHAEGFHRRWMGSNSAKHRWCERAAAMDIDMMCP